MKLVIYKSKDEFRWRIVARNGKILANGGEGYKRKSKLKKSLNNILNASPCLLQQLWNA